MRIAMFSSLTAGLLLSGFSGAAMAQDATTPEAADIQPLTKVTYLCQRNVELPVVYMNGLKNDEPMAVIYVEGKLVPMRSWPAASGARYIALDEQDSYRWHTKGDEGTLTFLAADDSAKEQTVLTGCIDLAKGDPRD